jgi:hypothetical protein
MTLLWLAVGLLAIFAFLKVRLLMQIAAARRIGLYPPPGRATTADVESLLRSGHRDWAIRCFREISNVSLAQAIKMVDKMAIR